MRKAGDKPCGCQHSEPEVFQTIWKHLKSDGMPDQAANHMTAEMLTHGEDFESSIEQYERNFANYKTKGFNEHAQAGEYVRCHGDKRGLNLLIVLVVAYTNPFCILNCSTLNVI